MGLRLSKWPNFLSITYPLDISTLTSNTYFKRIGIIVVYDRTSWLNMGNPISIIKSLHWCQLLCKNCLLINNPEYKFWSFLNCLWKRLMHLYKLNSTYQGIGRGQMHFRLLQPLGWITTIMESKGNGFQLLNQFRIVIKILPWRLVSCSF